MSSAGRQRFVAHMGVFSGKLAPNSMAAIEECLAAGVERIEIDVHSLAGDDYAVFHDHRLETHTSGSGPLGRAAPGDVESTFAPATTLRCVYIGLGVFAVLAVVCVIAGAVTMMRRRGDDGDDGGMSEAEFRKYEGFDD